jgi:hypothetical protein
MTPSHDGKFPQEHSTTEISADVVRKVKVWQKSCLSTGESLANQGKKRKKSHSVVIGHPPIGL